MDRPQDDVSQVIVILDVNPYLWGRRSAVGSSTLSMSFSQFVSHVALFLNSILLLNNLNHVAVIASGAKSCSFIFDSQAPGGETSAGKNKKPHANPTSRMLREVTKFIQKDEVSVNEARDSFGDHTLLSGSLSMALCYIQRFLKSGQPHPYPRIPIDVCMIGNEHSAFLQQASHLTGGIYLKPTLQEGLLQYLMVVFASDLHCRQFLQLPQPAGVDFRASCFCHKKTIDVGFVCSVCLSIFCAKHTSCSTCGAVYNQSRNPTPGQKRKTSEN